tara:strand:+ start:22227 stop:22697 length:471 start_codon:yes stop_codon:yes gene_type:complete
MKNFNGAYIRCDLGIRKILSAKPITNPPTVHSEYVVTVDGGSIPIEFKASYATLQRICCEPVPGVSLLGKPVIVCDEHGSDFNNLNDVLDAEAYWQERNRKTEVFVVTSVSYRNLLAATEVCSNTTSHKPTEVRINQASDMYSTFMLGFLANNVDL